MDNLFTLLERAADQSPQKVFLETPGEADQRLEITFAETLDKVNSWAQCLIADFKIQEHDRVAFMAPKCAEQVFMFYALWRIGAIAVPISETLGSEEVSFILADADPKAIFCDTTQLEKLSQEFEPQLFSELDARSTSQFEASPMKGNPSSSKSDHTNINSRQLRVGVATQADKSLSPIRQYLTGFGAGPENNPSYTLFSELDTRSSINQFEASPTKGTPSPSNSPCKELPFLNQATKCSAHLNKAPKRYDETACLIYTSGSTGRPKGVKLSHRNLMVNSISAGDKLPINSEDRFASLLPYWHSFSLTGEIILATYRQACLLFARNMREFSRLLPSWKPTAILVVPRMLAMYREMIINGIAARGENVQQLFDQCLSTANQFYTSSGCLNPDPNIRLTRQAHEEGLLKNINLMLGGELRFFISGGAPLAPELQEFFRNINLPVYQGYGLTESSPVISANTPGFSRTASSGTMLSWLHPDFGGDWTFVNEAGERGKQFHGELLVKGSCVMQGYWNHQDASAKVLENGWLHTGDMGYVVDGFLYLNGRASNLICLQGGEKVHPEHVEDVIRGLDSVSEVMIIGDGCKNIYALINKADEASDNSIVRQQIMQTIKSLAPFQRPKDLLFLPHFSPTDGTMTPTLKIRRKNIHALYAEPIKSFLLANCEKQIL